MFSRQGEKNTLQTKIRDICSVSMYKMLARYRLEPSRPEKHCHCIVKCVYEDVAYLRRGPMSVGLFHTYLQLHTYSHPLSLPQALSLTNAYLIIRVWYRRRRLAGSLFAYSNVIFVQILLLASKLKYLFLSLSLFYCTFSSLSLIRQKRLPFSISVKHFFMRFALTGLCHCTVFSLLQV